MKKVKSRILKIRNFKNIGLSKKDNEYQELYLDSYWNDKIVGNLIILIGENNIGKSNVLKSINMIQDTKEWEKNKNSSDIDNDGFQKELSNILENNRPNSPDYNDNSLIELIDEKEYLYSVNFENEKYEVKIKPNPNKIYDTKNIEKIKELLEKYCNLSEDIIKKISEDEDKFEDKDKEAAENHKNSFYRKLNLIDEIDDFTKFEIEYSKLQIQITQFIGFYNKIAGKYRENIKKSNIKELLSKYYNLSKDIIEKISEDEDKFEDKDKEAAEKFKNSFYNKLNSIDEIDDFPELETEYGKLQTQIKQFIHFYNNRVDEDKEIPEEDFCDIENIKKLKIKELLKKYYNLAINAISICDENEAEKFKNSFYNKLNSIDGIYYFTELETEYGKLKGQIEKFINFYNKRVDEDKEIPEEDFCDIENIEKSNIKELLTKYYNLAEDIIEKISEDEDEFEDKDKEAAEKFKNSFYNKLNSIDGIYYFTELETEYGKLKGQIEKFINFYNKRVDEGKEIPEEDFYDIDNIPEEYSDIPEEDFDDIEQTIPEGIDILSKIPNIVFYKRINLLAEDLIILNTQVDNETKFFTPLLNKIKVEIEKIKNIHSLNENQIKSFENSINNAIKPIFEQINKLATKVFGKNEYDFKIELDKEKIKLSMKINNEATTLLQQSEGFRWFFEFFFQFYFIYDLQAGDIILIDEPDAHLSIPSVKGLRNIIKKIAKEMGVTFVTTTHNPSFVDIDYFDEIRIVKKKKDGDGVEIVKFGDIDSHTEADTLKEIIDAFGLGNLNRDIITNPNNQVIFVEGITDYNYLTAFKLLYNRGKNDDEKLNLSFLPIAGLGQNKEESKNKIKILSKFKDVIQLTDEDEKANEFKEKMKVIKLTEIDENFKEIEYLFSENDKEKFKYIIKNKSFEISSLFKNIIFDLDEELEEETINNFNKVLVRLNEISQNLSDI